MDSWCEVGDCFKTPTLCEEHAAEDLKRRVALLEETLRLIQWGSCDGCGMPGQFCPQCKQRSTDYDADYNEVPGKHLPECFVGQALEGK